MVTAGAAAGRDYRHKCPGFLNIMTLSNRPYRSPAIRTDYVKSVTVPIEDRIPGQEPNDMRMKLNLK